MRIKLDENIPVSACARLAALGHDVDTVMDEALSGRPDSIVWAAAQRTQRLLVTQDLDFSDVRRFAPGTHAGILLVRLPDDAQPNLPDHLARWLSDPSAEHWRGCFVVGTATKIRVRRPRRAAKRRPVEPRDLEAVRAVLVETWHATYDATMGVERVTAITDDWHSIENLATEIGRAEHRFMLVEVGDEIVATGSADLVGDVATVQRLYVRPRHQGGGHGAELLAALVDGWEHTRVELKVAVHNARAIAFYERHGFAIVGRPDDEHFAMRRDA